jgi:DNA invertase Pin-like site-specific DNA recombinase
MAELERCIIIERVRAGMRRARLEGRQIGRSRLDVNRKQVIEDRRSGMSLTQVAKKHGISRASVCRLMKEARCAAVPAFAGSLPERASAAGAAQ